MFSGEPEGLDTYRALVRHWLHHPESDTLPDFVREVRMALWLEKREFQRLHLPEKK